ncbi:hypothetical protein [Helicobacter cetorum]|uniref:hypothetical protein n=1 Tax=Helicobacter cetorum TaxID=138563 RepID=UPI000CF0C883|nr:hypothetical protein [Helicobacter cetorum]
MQYATDPKTKLPIDVIDYDLKLARLGFKKPNDIPNELKARCPECGGLLEIRGGKDTKTTMHFYHRENVDCQKKDWDSKPYQNFSPKPFDPLQQERIRANIKFFNDNINLIYQKLQEIVGDIDVKNEFADIIQEANRLKICNYANLIKEHLPYILSTLINFLPKNSYQQRRKKTICCRFFDDGLFKKDLLWIESKANVKLYKHMFPNGSESFEEIEEVELETDYLTKQIKYELSEKQIECFNLVHR